MDSAATVCLLEPASPPPHTANRLEYTRLFVAHPEPVFIDVQGSPGIDSEEYRFRGIDSASLCSLAGQYDK
jgi:hypothetical protein